MESVLESQFPKIIDELMELVRNDSRNFFEAVSQTNNGENPYALLPLLHLIPAENFVDAWLNSPIRNWREVSYAIGNRYSHGRIEVDLESGPINMLD